MAARLLVPLTLALAAGAAVAVLPDVSPVPATRRLPPLPRHWERGAFMEIFVRAYADSDGDGIGDLRGLTQRLDHLKDLGVTGLWLMPVSASADRDHGYATTDHRALEPDYGTLADFDELLRQARRRGIGVIVDYVLNHAAAEHPWFVEARRDPASPWRRWFVWSQQAPAGWDIWGKNPWYAASAEPWAFRGDLATLQPAPGDPLGYYFGTFGPNMPDFDLRHPPVVDYHRHSLQFWLNRGIGGFRLDAVPHLVENDASAWNDQPESRALTRRFVEQIRRHPGRHVVCEATAKPQDWGDPALCGGAFAFGHVHHFVKAAKGEAASVQALAEYYLHARPTMATFVSNHDRFAGERLWDQVQGDERRYRLAAAAYLLQPGTPFIYYGEEIGQAGVPGLPGDQPLRAPMSWSAEPRGAGFTRGTPFRPLAPNHATHNVQAQRADAGSILNFYRALLKLRNGRASVRRGSYEHAFADGLVLGFQRRLGHERTLVLINYGTDAAEVRPPGLARGTRLRRLHAWPGTPGSVHAPRLTLPPQSVQVFDLP
ncbi:MAG: alpha-amylase family glycosyl hydrolase [Rubrivivax sp.]